ncbi:MAG: hypothetical protein U9N77_11920 [Thermodesulfobacteriota bacterium]|nr:hypothetical protein [Thermodesulfobacteriota bacterium]
MNYLYMRITMLLTIFFCLFFFNSVYAENIFLDKIVKELGTLEAAVIKGPGGRYLLNMGTDNNIKKGNLWILYTPGEQVIDPVTGKKLGILALSSAICKVTRVEKHFSEISVNCFDESCDIKSGFTARRYSGIKTMFQDVNGSSFHLYEQIRARLPLLDWQGYQKIKNSSNAAQLAEGLVIVADTGIVTIWSGGEILTVCDEMTSAMDQSQPEPGKSVRPVVERKKSELKQKTLPPPLGIMVPGVRRDLEIENYRAVASLDHMVNNLGIIEPDGTDTPYFIYLCHNTLYAGAVNNKEKYQYVFEGFGDVINMSIGPKGLIVLNIYVKNNGMESRILKFTTKGFTVLEKNINYILQFADIDRNGINDSLFGQDFDGENFFGSGVFHLAVDDSGSITQRNSTSTPAGFNLTGAFLADLDGNEIKETAYYNLGGKLVVYENSKKKWESPSKFGPIKTMLIDDFVNDSDAPASLPVWPQPALFSAYDITFAAVPANQADTWSLPSGTSKKGGLGILYPKVETYAFRMLNIMFQGIVQSVFIYDNELYIAVVEGNTFTGQGITNIFAVPINELVSCHD